MNHYEEDLPNVPLITPSKVYFDPKNFFIFQVPNFVVIFFNIWYVYHQLQINVSIVLVCQLTIPRFDEDMRPTM